MRVVFFIIFLVAVVLLFGSAQLLLLRQLNRVWWQKTWVRRSAYTLPVVGIISIVLLGLGEYHRIGWLSAVSGPATVLALILEVCLMFSLPVSGLFHFCERVFDRLSQKREVTTNEIPNRRRRLFLRTAAAMVPAAAVSAGLGGVGRAYAGAEVIRKTFVFENLSPALNGLVVLHLSDLHLRHYFTLDDLQEVLSEATVHRPDLILVTGDIADDLSLLPDALSMIAQIKPRLGCFATMGNHEYFRGPDQVRRHFAGSDVRLLIDESVRLPSGGASILLAGVDDPRSMRGDHTRFFKDRMSWMFSPRLGNEFRLLMSHRPDVFPHAAEKDINLTLAGHTHGAQIGFAGRSVLESSFPQSYLWGEYRIGKCQLYTTCGVGHWFPFRLGCPAEAPIIELRTE